jgi:hypothetical protein
MADRPFGDRPAGLAAQIDRIARAARLTLALDERQPDALRAEALGMPTERLFWTLTQLDGGLDLDACQALVRAVRPGRRRAARRGPGGDDGRAAAAAGFAAVWLRRRWADLPDAGALVAWLAGADAPPAAERAAGIRSAPPGPAGEAPPIEPAVPSPHPSSSWLDLPPLVGPPPGAADPSLAARLVGRLRRVGRR